MAHTYSHLFGLPATGLRFFTVYGPWGRPDMAPFKFADAIFSGKPIKVFNFGKHQRDFTYIDDIVDGVLRVLDKPAKPDKKWDGAFPDPASSFAHWRLYNIGNNQSTELMDFISCFEDATGLQAQKELLPLQAGDIPNTLADVEDLALDFNYKPSIEIQEGVMRFVSWYRGYYGV